MKRFVPWLLLGAIAFGTLEGCTAIVGPSGERQMQKYDENLANAESMGGEKLPQQNE